MLAFGWLDLFAVAALAGMILRRTLRPDPQGRRIEILAPTPAPTTDLRQEHP